MDTDHLVAGDSSQERISRRPPPEVVLAGAVIVLTSLHWTILILKLPIFALIPDWFWPFIPKPAGSVWQVLALLAVVILSVSLLLRSKHYGLRGVALIFLLGVFLQFGFALLEGRGLAALSDRIVSSGHAEFAQVAVEQEDMVSLLLDYEELVTSGQLGSYARSKPPGQLLFYVATAKLAGLVSGSESVSENLRALETTASLLWPVLSCAVLFPLYLLARDLVGRREALIACLLYVLVPSANLITLHTDQVLFPSLFTISLLAMSQAYRKDSMGLAILAGLLVYRSLYFSFALAFVLPLGVCLGVAWALKKRSQGKWQHFWKTTVIIGLTLISAELLFRLCLNYDILLRYQNSMAHHTAWKGWTPGWASALKYAAANLVEYAVWIGLPLAILTVWSVFGSLRLGLRRPRSPISIYGVALACVFLAVAFLGQTKGEAARLWMFLTPAACIAAARPLSNLTKDKRSGMLWLVVLLQVTTTYLIKVNQDFW